MTVKAKRPAKPYHDFPLTWHPSGYWCKKIRSKLHYFGPRWGSWQEALAEYQRDRDDLHAGRTPRSQHDGLTLADLCNHYLTFKKSLVASGELRSITYNDCVAIAREVVTILDRNLAVDQLQPSDFQTLRFALAKDRAPSTLKTKISNVKAIFNYAFHAGLVDRPINVKSFQPPSKKVLRSYLSDKDDRLFERQQIIDLVDAADDQMRAMILLGINCALGNTDVGSLQRKHLDSGWLDYPRPKTGERRRSKLWPETEQAIRNYGIEVGRKKRTKVDLLIFATRRQGRQQSSCNVSRLFRGLLEGLGIYRSGLSFYSLRHTFRTVADECRDQPACDLVMGHADPSMAARYRQRISDDRLERVAEHVHRWLFG